MVAVNGFVEKGFEKVESVFRENFSNRGEVGAACAVYRNGELVVDLWGGHADRKKTRPWKRDTKALVFSSTKGLSSLSFASLHSKGILNFDAKIKDYWPEFAINGKEDITVRQLLAHEAGLMVIDKLLSIHTLKKKDKLASILAGQRPQKAALGKKAYHTWTISLYQSEIARRVDPLSRSIGTLFNDEIALPLDADFHIGIPHGIDDDEIAEIIPFEPVQAILHGWNQIPFRLLLGFWDPYLIPLRSFMNPPVAFSPLIFNQRFIREMEIGSVTGIGTARAMAKIYGEFANGCPNLDYSPQTIKELEAYHSNPNDGLKDMVLKVNLIYSLGLEKPSSFFNFGSDQRAFGHQGAGGSAGFADPAKRVGFAYVMNKMGTNIANDPREKALRDAVYDCL
ncbi:MAG: beta-lactamase family protein [Bacteroidetes bacterium]|nr:beta-lactamase family protein [Bacteroidota bacterium]